MKLRRQEVERYLNEGFPIVEGLLSRREVQPVMDDIGAVVDEIAQRLHAAGRIQDLYFDHGFDTRLAALEAGCPGAAIRVTHLMGLIEALTTSRTATPHQSPAPGHDNRMGRQSSRRPRGP